MLGDGTVVVRRQEPLTSQLESETVMFDPVEGRSFTLSPIGTRIWELLEQPRSVGELCAHLEDQFDVDTATCRRDVETFLVLLRDATLIEVRPSG